MPDTSMQQLSFVAPEIFEWQEVIAPKISSPEHAIVRPLSVARCDLDLYIAKGVVPMKNEPFAFGHEIAGEVIEIGSGVTDFAAGDKVIVPFQINCGTCDMCRFGCTNSCTSVPPYSAYGLAQSSGREWGGGFSDFVLVPFADAMLVSVPETVSLHVAATISDNSTDGYRTVAEPLLKRPGADVLIVGGLAQSVGLFAVQSALALGAGRVVYTDFNQDRLVKAKSLGAEVMFISYDNNTQLMGQFPVVVDASNLSAGLVFALRSTSPSGFCTGVSAGTDKMNGLPLYEMYMKGITYEISRAHARGQMGPLLDCVACGQINPAEILSPVLKFSDAPDAMCLPDTKLVFAR